MFDVTVNLSQVELFYFCFKFQKHASDWNQEQECPQKDPYFIYFREENDNFTGSLTNFKVVISM